MIIVRYFLSFFIMKIFASKRLKAAQLLPDDMYIHNAQEAISLTDTMKKTCTAGKYTLKVSDAAPSKVLVYQGELRIAALHYTTIKLDGLNYISISFYYGDKKDLTDILAAIINHGSIFNDRYDGLISDDSITASTFNAYMSLLRMSEFKQRAYIYDSLLQRYILISNYKTWSAVCSRADKAKSYKLILLRRGASIRSTNIILDLEFIKELASRYKRKATSGKPLERLFNVRVPNTNIRAEDWNVINDRHSDARYVKAIDMSVCVFEMSAAESLDDVLVKQRQFKKGPAEKAALKVMDASDGFRYGKIYKVGNSAVSLLFYVFKTSDTEFTMTRQIIAANAGQ